MSLKSVCVYCGSRAGVDPAYATDAHEIGVALAENGWRLVYGAGDVGLMGTVARAAQDAGGKTFGVIPQHLVDWEVGKTDLTTYIVTETMHERKKVMFMNCDAVVVLPGGAGSLDELFEALTWRQLGLHEKAYLSIKYKRLLGPINFTCEPCCDTRFRRCQPVGLYHSGPRCRCCNTGFA